MGLFDKLEASNLEDAKPLAARMRPRSLAEFAGQKHFLGDGKLLRRILEADRLSSEDVAGRVDRYADEVGVCTIERGFGRSERSSGFTRAGSRSPCN
jgi:hypothetical protein